MMSRIGRRTRARRMAAVVAVVGLAVLALGMSLIATTVDSVAQGTPVVNAGGEDVTVSFVGDTLLGDEADALMVENGPEWVMEQLDRFPETDVVIANLEGPVTNETEAADPTQRWSYNAKPSTVAGLAAFGVDAVSLANNHAMDRGPVGLSDTRTNTKAAGIASFGAGASSDEARAPLMIDADGGRIAVVGLADIVGMSTASSERPGARRLSLNNLQADHDAARDAKADYVIAFVHWGENYAKVTDRQRDLAQALVDAGYDLVVGAGAHLAQPMELLDGTPVFYSVGNFVFGTPGRYTPDAAGFSLSLRATVDFERSVTFEVSCIETDNAIVAYQPRPCARPDAQRVLSSLHPDMAVADQQARLTVALD